MSHDKTDIRWVQRFAGYEKALDRLGALVESAGERELGDVEKDALIQRFEYTQELSWLVIRDFYQAEGDTDLQGSRSTFTLAFKRGLIKSGETLLATINSRNNAAHSYDEEKAEKVISAIIEEYYDAFEELRAVLTSKKEDL